LRLRSFGDSNIRGHVDTRIFRKRFKTKKVIENKTVSDFRNVPINYYFHLTGEVSLRSACGDENPPNYEKSPIECRQRYDGLKVFSVFARFSAELPRCRKPSRAGDSRRKQRDSVRRMCRTLTSFRSWRAADVRDESPSRRINFDLR